jgi:hypothetical protein
VIIARRIGMNLDAGQNSYAIEAKVSQTAVSSGAYAF